jgi:hypothetical protein
MTDHPLLLLLLLLLMLLLLGLLRLPLDRLRLQQTAMQSMLQPRTRRRRQLLWPCRPSPAPCGRRQHPAHSTARRRARPLRQLLLLGLLLLLRVPQRAVGAMEVELLLPRARLPPARTR